MSNKKISKSSIGKIVKPNYSFLVKNISSFLKDARKTSVRVVNTILTATYWEIGRRIVEYEQLGAEKAVYGRQLLQKLSEDLSKTFGKGFSVDNLESMRLFYLAYPSNKISETLSRKFKPNKSETPSRIFNPSNFNYNFPLPWSHYVMLIRRVKSEEARRFYESEALHSGWSVRQLDRQISSQFYERTLLSKNKSAMLKKGRKAKSEDAVTPEEEIKDPFILEFLGLKDEYSENDLEETLIVHLEKFLLELGGDFTFVGRQKRLRIGNEWYRMDLLFFHRKLKCLVVIDLKVGKFTHADAGQMQLYVNYAKAHWTNAGENPPVGLILCTENDSVVAKYSLYGSTNKILATEYRINLPTEKDLAEKLKQTRKFIEQKNLSRKE